MPEGRWDQAMEAARFTCVGPAYGLTTPCDGPLIVHHRILKGSGGTSDPSIHDLDHLAVLCGGVTGSAGHHGQAHENRDGESYANGLLIRRAGRPIYKGSETP